MTSPNLSLVKLQDDTELFRQGFADKRGNTFMGGFLEGVLQGLAEHDKVAPRWCAVARSSQNTAFGYAWGYRTQRNAEKAALSACPAPRAQILTSRAGMVVAVARGPQGAIGFQWAHLNMLAQAQEDAIQRCQTHFPFDAPERERVWLALVLDSREGLMYQQWDPIA